MQELSRTLSFFLWPISFAFGAFFTTWVAALWVLDAEPERLLPRLVALVMAFFVYMNVREKIDGLLGPGLSNFALFPLRYAGAHLLAVPFVVVTSALVWRVLLLDLLPGWFIWLYLAGVFFIVWPWWVQHFLLFTFSFQLPPAAITWLVGPTGVLPRVLAPLLRLPVPPWMGTLAGKLSSWAEGRSRDRERRVEHVSGPKLLTHAEATRIASAMEPGEERLGWGAPLPRSEGPLGFFLIGAPGTGKSLRLQSLMASVVSDLGLSGDRRALVYDHKGETLALLSRFGVPRARVKLFHPFARETAVWDMAADLQDETDIKEFTHIVFEPPAEFRGDPFWSQTAELVAQGTILGLVAKRGRKWAPRDFCLAQRSVSRIRSLIAAAPNGKYHLQFLDEPEHRKVFLSVLTTMQSALQDLEPIAKQWHFAEKELGAKRFSLKDWMAGSDVLVLGNSEAHSRVFSKLNRTLFTLAAKRLFDGSRHDEAENPERTWVFLDEAQNAAKRTFEALPRIVNAARGKGACVVLGAQDLVGLEKSFPGEAKSMVNALSHWAAFRINTPDTAKWIASAFGKRKVRERLERRNRAGVPEDTSERLFDEELVRSEDLTKENAQGMLRAFLKSESLGVWKDEMKLSGMAELYGSPSQAEKVEAGPTRYAEKPTLPDWTVAELRQLGLEGDDDDTDTEDEGYRPHVG